MSYMPQMALENLKLSKIVFFFCISCLKDSLKCNKIIVQTTDLLTKMLSSMNLFFCKQKQIIL